MTDKDSLEVTKLENQDNYTLWMFEVRIALKSKGLFGYVQGTEAKPTADKAAELKAYEKSSAQAESIILCSIARNLRSNLINCSSPKEMWDKLAELYGDTSADAKQAAWKQFYAFRITESEAVVVQLERFESILRKLDDIDTKPSEEAIVSKLLSSLPDKFEFFSVAWECTPKADRTKKTLIARLIKEDNRLTEKEATALALHVQKASFNEVKSEAKKKKHSKKDIEELKKKTRCALCKEKGHWVRECPQNNPEESDKNLKTVKSTTAFVCDIVTSYKCTSGSEKDYFIADTGASNHMTFRRDFFSEFRPNPLGTQVKVADGRHIDAPGIGTITILEEIDGVLYEREMQDVLYVPELGCNLFSVGSVNRKGLVFSSDENGCEVRDKDNNLMARGVPHVNHFRMLFKVKMLTECNAVQTDEQSKLNLWHARMGHFNYPAVKHTGERFGIDGVSHENFEFCEECILDKQTKSSHPSSVVKSIYGPAFVSTQLGTKIKVLRTDNGTGKNTKPNTLKIDFGLENKAELVIHAEQQAQDEIQVQINDNADQMIDLEMPDVSDEPDIKLATVEENCTWTQCALPQDPGGEYENGAEDDDNRRPLPAGPTLATEPPPSKGPLCKGPRAGGLRPRAYPPPPRRPAPPRAQVTTTATIPAPTDTACSRRSSFQDTMTESSSGRMQFSRCIEAFTRFLREFNLVSLASDKCVYVSEVQKRRVSLAIYVDNGLTMNDICSVFGDSGSSLDIKRFNIFNGAPVSWCSQLH